MKGKLFASAGLVALVAAVGGGASVSTASSAADGWTVPGEVLVRFADGTSATRAASAHGAVGAEVVKSFTSVSNLQLVRVGSAVEAIAAYSARPEVLYAQPNFVYRLGKTPDDPSYPDMYNLNNTGQTGGTPNADIDAPAAWERGTGTKKVAVGVVDTGIDYDHEDLAAHAKPNKKECNGQASVDDDSNGYVDDCHGIDTINGDTDPMDDHSHGSHTSGTIGAVGDNGKGVVGVNWKVTIIACKSHNTAGVGTSASIIECFQYMEIMKAKGLDVVATNNSYGGCSEACGFDYATRDAIASNGDKGILFIASAGNDDTDNDQVPKYPTDYFLPNVISVAATDHNDAKASFSNYGDRAVHVGAPGVDILSTVPGDSYELFSGTSMAGPHVVGLAALLEAQKPKRTWKAIRNLILTGGDEVPGLDGRTVTGRRISANGSGTCSNTRVQGVLRPLDTQEGKPIPVAYLDVRCAKPAGSPLTATITPGGTEIDLVDNGTGGDGAAKDGIYSGEWSPNPCVPGTYTFAFSNGPTVQSIVTCAP